ncbi:MAG: hypothetical protein RBU29_04790 [bacterium]|nr:hypothetical protein [bacterium]
MKTILRLSFLWLCLPLSAGLAADGLVWNSRDDFWASAGIVETMSPGDWILHNENLAVRLSSNTGLPQAMWLRGEAVDWFVDGVLHPFNPGSIQCSQILYRQVPQKNQAWLDAILNSVDWPGVRIHCRSTLQDGWKGLWTVMQFENKSGEEQILSVTTPGDKTQTICGITVTEENRFAFAKGALAYTWLDRDGCMIPEGPIHLAPGESFRCGLFLALGHSPAEAFGIAASLQMECGYVAGRLIATDMQPVTSAHCIVHAEEGNLIAYPNAHGGIEFMLPIGTYDMDIVDLGRAACWDTAVVWPGDTYYFETVMDPPSSLRLHLCDAQGQAIPCRLRFAGIGETPDPDFSLFYPNCPTPSGWESRGGEEQIRLSPGSYRLTVIPLAERYDIPPVEIQVTVEKEAIVDVNPWIDR